MTVSIIHFQKVAAARTEIKSSVIHGKGLFATSDFQAGDTVVPRFMTKGPGDTARTQWDQSEQARFTNHSGKANCGLVLDEDYVKLVADRDIVSGEELTADYDSCEPILGKDFDFTYRGRAYNGDAQQEKTAVNKNQPAASKRTCPGCSRPFKKDEPYPDVSNCEACERFGPPKLVKAGGELAVQIANARKETAKPTPAQAAAGNYAKGKVSMHGFTITLENPKGSTRSGTSRTGKAWSNTMVADYGYINGTEGKDGDHVDVFIGPHPEAEMVFVVDQIDPGSGHFDEHKCLFGFQAEAEAEACYQASYDKGWSGLKDITPLTMRQFRWWLKHGDQHKPLAGVQVKNAAESIYLNALHQTPVAYNPRVGVLDNVTAHLSAVKARGDRTIDEAGAQDRLQNAADPNRSTRQLLSFMNGSRKPLVQHPLDRLLAGSQR